MGNTKIAGISINQIKLKDFILSKKMFLPYFLLALGLWGLFDVYSQRYFFSAINMHDIALSPDGKEVMNGLKEAISGDGGEVKREAPWTLYIVNYMYMIYSGSGIIFLVALAEIFNVDIIKKTAAGFMSLGLAMIFGGLFTIAVDLNVLHMHWMFLSPHFSAGMWLMLPLYIIYIPFVLFEIYLLMTDRYDIAKKFAIPILFLSIVVDIVEYYIQARLFSMNTARHLWTTYPMLTIYLIVSSFVASAGIMMLYSMIVYRDSLKKKLSNLLDFLVGIALYAMAILGAYEATAYLFIDKAWGGVMLFGEFKYYFFAYVITAVGIPFVILFRRTHSIFWITVASIFIICGTYLGRIMFVYGGNAFPMSDTVGTGFQKYGEYEIIQDYIFFFPHYSEVLIVLGSIGVVMVVYNIIESLFSVSKLNNH